MHKSSGDGVQQHKTYGQKPTKFQLEEDGDYYMIGSEVYGTVLYDNTLLVIIH